MALGEERRKCLRTESLLGGPLWVWTSFLVLAGDDSFRELRCEPVGRSLACSVNTSAILLRPGPTITLPWDLLIALFRPTPSTERPVLIPSLPRAIAFARLENPSVECGVSQGQPGHAGACS